mgnify:CR=1 FL=1
MTRENHGNETTTCKKEMSLCSNCSRDWLTGLYSRVYLEQHLEKEVKQAVLHHGSLWVMMIDIDNFKEYNTELGHQGGDFALRTVSCVLKSGIRSNEIAARYGGDEFTLVFSREREGDALLFAERLRKRVNELVLEGKQMSISIGLAECPKVGKTVEEIIRAADGALLKAKRRGKNQVQLAR